MVEMPTLKCSDDGNYSVKLVVVVEIQQNHVIGAHRFTATAISLATLILSYLITFSASNSTSNTFAHFLSTKLYQAALNIDSFRLQWLLLKDANVETQVKCYDLAEVSKHMLIYMRNYFVWH